MNDHSNGGGGHDPQQNTPHDRPDPSGTHGFPPADGAPPQAYNQQQGGGYPQQGNYSPQGDYPQQGYPQDGGYPPPPTSGPPQPGGYPRPGYPQQSGYPPPPGYSQPGGFQQGAFQQGAFQQGGFQQGGYPPPPGYANFPTQNQWEYGYTPPRPTRVGVGDALDYGWKKFAANVGVWLGFMGLFLALLVAFYVVAVVVIVARMSTSNRFEDADYVIDDELTVATIVVTAIVGVVSYLAGALLVRGALLELDGAKPSFGAFWKLNNVGNIVVLAVVLAIATALLNGIGSLFIALTLSIAIGILVWFAIHFMLDHEMSVVAAPLANLKLIRRSPGTLALLYLALAGLNLAGFVLCGLGLFVTVPVSIIATTYAYRVLSGGYVSPAG